MELVCKRRGEGKTHDLILKSAETGIPILTAFNSRYITEQATYMGVRIPQPMTVKEYKYLMDNEALADNKFWTGSLLVDDIDEVLNQMLGVKVETATYTPDSYEASGEIVPSSLYCSSNNKLNPNPFIEKKFHLPNGVNIIARNNEKYRIEFPKVTDVKVIVPDKVVEVEFEDGTKEKAVCKEPDVFSLETAISICISKKIMGGSGEYNNAVKHGMKVYNDRLKREAAIEAGKELLKKKNARKLERKKHKEAERKQAERERQIEIQKEAYIRAMEYIRNTTDTEIKSRKEDIL